MNTYKAITITALVSTAAGMVCGVIIGSAYTKWSPNKTYRETVSVVREANRQTEEVQRLLREYCYLPWGGGSTQPPRPMPPATPARDRDAVAK